MNYDLLTDIIEKFKIYNLNRLETAKSNIFDFAEWIKKNENQSVTNSFEERSTEFWQQEIEVGISRLLLHNYRYAKILMRNTMADFPELANEDFTYLYTLVRLGKMSKTQLIEKNIHEKPTGMEIIKRLLKHGLIEEKNDYIDKRCKLISITKKGENAYKDTKRLTSNLAKLISGNLDLEEKTMLFQILKKLDKFHKPIYLSKRSMSADSILESMALL